MPTLLAYSNLDYATETTRWQGTPAIRLGKQPRQARPQRYGLREPRLTRLVSASHTDADLGRPIEVVTDMSKSRRLGFLTDQPTDERFFERFQTLRETNVIP